LKFKIVEEIKPENYGIEKYKFRSDGTLDVFQNVDLENKNLEELPFKFGKIDGDFDCSWNKLTSLEGAPKIVNGNFFCQYNKLTSLEGLNLDGIVGKIYIYGNPNLKLTEKEELWMTLNPGRLILEI